MDAVAAFLGHIVVLHDLLRSFQVLLRSLIGKVNAGTSFATLGGISIQKLAILQIVRDGSLCETLSLGHLLSFNPLAVDVFGSHLGDTQFRHFTFLSSINQLN